MSVALVTGASRGLGLHTALRLAAEGLTVFAGARDPGALADRLRATADGSAVQPAIRPLALDVTDDDSVAAAVERVGAVTGALDVLINNAGIPGSWAPAADIGPEDFADVFATNVFGVARVTRAFLPLLLRARHPRLVMVSSGMGSLTLQTRGEDYRSITHLPYPASKAAVNMLAVQYAKGLPGVLVTAVDPGLTATEFTDHTGHTVDEGADAIVAAALDVTGPSGRFLDREGVQPW